MKVIKNIHISFSKKEIDYKSSVNIMEKRVFDILNNNEKEFIWFLNHPNIFTMGSSGNKNQIKQNIDLPIIDSNRGGKITYHGPGQRIVYSLINLNNRKKDIRKFVNIIEKSAIDLLKEFNIEAVTYSNRVGIWVIRNQGIKLDREEKIGAIGLRIKKWVTYHGLSFNLEPNLEYYNYIDACGLKNYKTTSMKKLGVKLSTKKFDEMYLRYFLKNLDTL